MRSATLLAAVAASSATVLVYASSALAAVPHPDVVSEDPARHTPHVASDALVARPEVYTMAQAGDTMVAGGKFQTVESADRATTYARSNLFTFSATTGELTDLAPDVDGSVWALATDGTSVYVGGQFQTVGGELRPTLAKIDATTGELDPSFNPPMKGGRVTELVLVNGRLLVGGSIQAKLVALDPVTGRNTGYLDLPITGKVPNSSGDTNVYKFAVNPAGTRLVGVGNFTAVDGLNRQRGFMLDLGETEATLSDWYYKPLDKRCLSNTRTRQAYLEDVDFSPDGSYFVLVSTGFVTYTKDEIGETLCDAAARFETDIVDPDRPTWINYTGGDTIHAVAVTGAAVYVQGHFRWLDNPQGKDSKGPGAVDRLGIGAIDPTTGSALGWDPPKPARRGGLDLLATSKGLWVPSDSKRFGGKYHRGIAFCAL